MDKIYCQYFNLIITKIQSVARGYLARKELRKPKDKMTLDIVVKMLDRYNDKIIFNNEINMILSKKKIRNENFPSEISENLVKFCKVKQIGIMGTWDTKSGDLVLMNKKIEIKGFSSTGPSSFGPIESWDWIYFVDCVDHLNKNFKIYEIKMSNNNNSWKNIKVNSTQTVHDQCVQKRRPRLHFKSIQKQLGAHCKLIFNGNISELRE